MLAVLHRFFLMYLINKDETEHTGQVSVSKSLSLCEPLMCLCNTLNNVPSTPSLPSGVLCMEDVPGEMLGLLPSWRLF